MSSKTKKIKLILGSLVTTAAIVVVPTAVVACSGSNETTNSTNTQSSNNDQNTQNIAKQFIQKLKSKEKEISINKNANITSINQITSDNIESFLVNFPQNDKNVNINFENIKINQKTGILSFTVLVTSKINKLHTYSISMEIKGIKIKNSINQNLELINNKTNKMEEVVLPKSTKEQFILSSQYYSGNINYIKGNNYGDNRLESEFTNTIGINGQNSNSSVIQMGKNDSLILVFNQNDNWDNSSMYKYINSLYFNDPNVNPDFTNNGLNSTDVISGQDASNITTISWQQSAGAFIKFDKTELSSWYYGSVNTNINPPNNQTTLEYLESIAHSYKNYPTQWEQILSNWGYMLEKGKIVSNPNSQSNGYGWPLGIIHKNIWTIKQIAKNAFTFTFNASPEEIPTIAQATIGIIQKNKTGLLTYNPITPMLSLGSKIQWEYNLQQQGTNIIGARITWEIINNKSNQNNAIIEMKNEILYSKENQ